MNITTKIATWLLCATVTASCTKVTDKIEEGELDWSQTGTITVGEVAMATGTKASTAMGVGETFRLYALNPKTKSIIATKTYTITTTAGVPVPDDADKDVVLPYGLVEIFLVGPVKATDELGIESEIASASRVYPMVGVDLVSSRTEVVIRRKSTPITPNPLKHKMVKLEVEVNMMKDVAGGTKSTYRDGKLDNEKHYVILDNVSDAGVFTFDDAGGTVTGTSTNKLTYTYKAGNTGDRKILQAFAGEEILVGEGTAGAIYKIHDYVLPTPPTTPKLTASFGYTFREGGLIPGKEILAHEMSGRTPLPQVWDGGTYVKISTTLIPSIIMTLQNFILPWDDGGTTPIAPSPDGGNNLLFWYSGDDAPEDINGKLCWRDRSGNGNHAEIVGNMIYDAENKCYSSTRGAYFRIPSLGAVPEYTLELTAQSERTTTNTAADFNSLHGILLNIPYNNIIAWYNSTANDWGQSTVYEYGVNDIYIFEQLTSYALCRNQTTAAVIINGKEKLSQSKAGPWSDFTDNRLWLTNESYTGNKQKLYGARMYRKYMNDASGRSTLIKNHTSKLSNLGVNAPVLNGTTLEYVKEGLIVDLRGETAPTGSPRVWTDQSGRGNSPKLDAGVSQFNNDARETKYYGGLTASDMIRFPKSLGTYKEITIEIVTEFRSSAVSHPLIQFKPNTSSQYLSSGIYWCYSGIGYIFEAPYLSANAQKVTIPLASLKYTQQGLSQLSCYRQGDKLYASQNGYVYSDYASDIAPDKVNELINGLIYTDFQHIYAVRIYNRALSDIERQHNYLVDKDKYKILP